MSPRILLVDDNELVRESLGMILEHDGFHVSHAGDVTEALDLIASQPFDVLLTDLRIPQAGDGLSVASAMRNSQPRAVTIIFSGYPEMRSASAAIILQADKVLVKQLNHKRLATAR
jgi:DNA-binding NtrC family response regulator